MSFLKFNLAWSVSSYSVIFDSCIFYFILVKVLLSMSLGLLSLQIFQPLQFDKELERNKYLRDLSHTARILPRNDERGVFLLSYVQWRDVL